MPTDDILNQGPKTVIAPPLGGNTTPQTGERSLGGIKSNLADSISLDNKLKEIIRFCNDLLQSFDESDLVKYALVIGDGAEDKDLRDAHKAQWPPSLGNPKSYISYRYYKSLATVDAASAKYIRQRFEEALRDVSGTTVIDLVSLVKIVLNEALLVQEFVANHVGDIDDSSEFRIMELFQEWCDSAWRHLAKMQAFFQGRNSVEGLPKDETNVLSENEARQSQTVFKIKLNSLNGEIVSHTTLLQKNFADYSTLFFNNFLGPALQFRLNVGRRIYPDHTTILGEEINKATDALHANLSVMIADQLRRNKFFDEKFSEIEDLIRMRNTYRVYIEDLASKGQKVPTGTPGYAMKVSESLQDTAALDALIATRASAQANTITQNRFVSSHGSLDNLTDPDAHPQYLLLTGGKLTGDLVLSSGIKIGGIIPSTHAHDGKDGSSRINGRDIIPGTIDPTLIDSTNKPKAPTNLRLVKTTQRTASGVLLFDLGLAWNTTDSSYSFEIQYAAV